jgi:proteic killer suppression protein
MIVNFASKTAQDIYDGQDTRYARKLPMTLHAKAQRLFDQLNVSTRVETLNIPPGNALEALKGDLKGYWSIRINKQWRIIFQFRESNAYEVNIVDYHELFEEELKCYLNTARPAIQEKFY